MVYVHTVGLSAVCGGRHLPLGAATGRRATTAALPVPPDPRADPGSGAHGLAAAAVPGVVLGLLPPSPQLRAELRGAGFQVLDLVAVEGMRFMLHDLAERMADPMDRAVVLECARATERVPELLGIGPDLLATAVRPKR